ncbi:hypothetical protein GCM10011613_24040 [Cellvibrio zantedeschiae]|uniref:Uncharacterized protein n=1 Tax=Cellvibrio zantedeschiae TaxID=1237077 RepID=A0ABQ3B6Z8_9GAMM|nr:hypothetical protein [Cellvibrio zantedeschiae]GGY78546.1 hypothetical protein GCM10011613_24040 [Cellvibrio zantedeschiae]
MNWKIVLEEFKHQDMLVDIYYEQMDTEAWVRVFNWLANCPELKSINCYIPTADENLQHLPENIGDYIEQEGFYCFISLTVSGIDLYLRFYIKSEIEGDILPKDIDTEEKLLSLLEFLEKIRLVAGVPKYIVCPENCKKAYIINGQVV